MKFDICMLMDNLSRKTEFRWNITRVEGTLHEDQCTFLTISHPVLLRMKNVSDRLCRENENTHLIFSNLFFSISCRLWGHVGKYSRAVQARDDNMAHANFTFGNYGCKHTLTVCNTYMVFFCNSSCTNAPQWYVISTFPVLSYSFLVRADCKVV